MLLDTETGIRDRTPSRGLGAVSARVAAHMARAWRFTLKQDPRFGARMLIDTETGIRDRGHSRSLGAACARVAARMARAWRMTPQH